MLLDLVGGDQGGRLPFSSPRASWIRADHAVGRSGQLARAQPLRLGHFTHEDTMAALSVPHRGRHGTLIIVSQEHDRGDGRIQRASRRSAHVEALPPAAAL